MNGVIIYAILALFSFVFFLRSAKRTNLKEKYEGGAIVVALACFIAAVFFPVSWVFIASIFYLERGEK